MSQKATKKKTRDHYHVGEYLWRTTDNALFKVVQINTTSPVEDDIATYDLECVNNASVDDETVYVKNVHDPHSIYTSYQPSKPVKGQHVWNLFIDQEREKEFIVEDVVEKKWDPSDLDPCKKCHNGVCEQCNWGYRPKSEVLAEVGYRKKPETIITLMNLSGHKKQTITLEQFNASFTMLPPHIYEIDKFVKEEIKSIRDNSLGCEESEEKAEKEVDDVMNDKLEKESIDTGTTVDNSYDTWKNNLKIVNVAKFDQKYFQRGLAYHVRKRSMDGDGFNGIMFSVDENTLQVMKLGEAHINYQYNSELVEIQLKEYMDGRWSIVRLVEEVK
jgi:hypothetical protein